MVIVYDKAPLLLHVQSTLSSNATDESEHATRIICPHSKGKMLGTTKQRTTSALRLSSLWWVCSVQPCHPSISPFGGTTFEDWRDDRYSLHPMSRMLLMWCMGRIDMGQFGPMAFIFEYKGELHPQHETLNLCARGPAQWEDLFVCHWTVYHSQQSLFASAHYGITVNSTAILPCGRRRGNVILMRWKSSPEEAREFCLLIAHLFSVLGTTFFLRIGSM